jgi:hypothetical protein
MGRRRATARVEPNAIVEPVPAQGIEHGKRQKDDEQK